jgi:HK97 family phage portal protein
MKWYNPKTWFRRAPEASYSNDPITEERIIELIAGGYGIPTASGIVVNEQTAMRVSTVYRCVSLLAGTIASLPCEVYRSGKDGRSDPAYDHPAYWLLQNEPNPMMTANNFWKSFLYKAFMRGNGYGLIARSGLGAPLAVFWIRPECVSVGYSPDYTRHRYIIRKVNGQTQTYDQDDVIHYPFIGFDGLEGRAPLECGRDAIGLSAAGQEFNETFFTHGNASDIAMEFPGNLGKEQAQQILDAYEKNRTGMNKMRLPLIAQGGGKIHRLDFNASDSQLIESRAFSVEDTCRFFGVPPHMVGHTSKQTSWGSGIEEQTLGFVKFTLRDILKGLEQEIDRKVLRSGRFFCKFNLDALLRADSKGRAEFFKAALGGTQSPGFMTVNEVRALENLPPIEGGDKLYAPVPADKGTKGGDNGGTV